MKNKSGMLDGLIVLDLTQFLAGPYGTQILGDLGATIIKIETNDGEMSRKLPPHFHRGEGAYYLSVNRNKKSISLDLKQEEGYEVFLKLVEKADVVIDNYRPGVLQKLRIDYPTLKQVNPKIICCSISGFGQDGPYNKRPAYDMVVQALSGGMSLTGERGRRPVRSGIPIGDLCAGMFAINGILAALYERDRSGKGDYIDVSMLDVQISMLSYQGVYYLMSDEVPGTQGRHHLSIPTYGSFTAKDDVDVIITANTEKMWEKLCIALENPELSTDEKFSTNALRLKNQDELITILNHHFQQFESKVIIARLIELGIPAAPIQTIDKALEDEQVRHRGMVQEIDHVLGGTIKVLGNPIKSTKYKDGKFESPPILGQHTTEILKDFLDYGDEYINELLTKKVVR